MSTRIGDGTTDTNVDATSHGLVVQNPKTLGQEGLVDLAVLVDAGVVTGSRLARAIAATLLNRLEVSQATPLFSETFNYVSQDQARWSNTLTTLTVTYSGGTEIINGTGVTTGSAAAMIQSYATFTIPTEGALVYRHFGYLTQVAQANCTVEFGFLYASGTTVPTDGVFFRYKSDGTLHGVLNYNGTETESASITLPTAGAGHKFVIIMDATHAEFWIDGVLQVSLVPSSSTQAQPMMTGAVRIGRRMYHASSAPGLANQFKTSDIDLWQTDGNINRSSAYERAQSGLMGYSGASGMTAGSTSFYANSSNPTAQVPSNTSAVLGVGLGGQFWETASISTGVDGIICSFQVPAPTVNLTPRKLVITGIRWQSMVQTILAGGPFLYQHGIAFGHSAVSLATIDGAATKAPRRIALGQSVFAATAAVGTQGANISMAFASPIVVNPGEFVAFCVKNIGTVGTSGTIAHSITVDAHWE